jgi:hypothetical protein
MGFPKRVFTKEEIEKARNMVKQGYKHRLKTIGDKEFKQKVKEALKLVKTVNLYNFLRTYIEKIVEVDGLSQLRESEAAIWVNKYQVKDPVEAASFFAMKSWQMKQFLNGKPYFGGEAEEELNQKRIEFLEKLMKKTRKEHVKKRCEELLKSWRESTFL